MEQPEKPDGQVRTFMALNARAIYVVGLAISGLIWGQRQESQGLERGQAMGRAEIQGLLEANTREISNMRGDINREFDDVKVRLGRLEARNDHR